MRHRVGMALVAGAILLGVAGVAGAQSTEPPVKPPPPLPPDGGVAYYYTSFYGTVQTVGDASITLQTSDTPARTVEVLVNQSTQYVRRQSVDVDQVAPGNVLWVSGLPARITAQNLSAGDDVVAPPAPAPLPPGAEGGTTPGPAGSTHVYTSASAYASGTVLSVDKASRIIVLSLNDGTQVPVDVPVDVRINRTLNINLSGVKVGDPIVVGASAVWDPSQTEGGGMGEPKGPFTATYVQVGDVAALNVPSTTPVGVAGGAPPPPPSVPPSVAGDSTGTGATAPARAVVKGSLTGSGRVTASDVQIALRIAVGLQQATTDQLAAGDLFSEGRITLRDVMLILRAAATGAPL